MCEGVGMCIYEGMHVYACVYARLSRLRVNILYTFFWEIMFRLSSDDTRHIREHNYSS